ncbi:MAG: hypothetical protein KC613_01235, partial [Myxococcales bacterium]|nr:hypothetical protein [Myxococcales bacterium]
MTARRPDALTDALLRLTLPLADPPGGELPSADEMAALGEGTLSPAEEAELLRRVDGSAAARAELRALYPARFKALFEAAEAAPAGGAPPSAKVLRFPTRWGPATSVAVGRAAAAAAAVFLAPLDPPEGAQLSVGVSALERGAAPGDVSVVAPGQAVDVY